MMKSKSQQIITFIDQINPNSQSTRLSSKVIKISNQDMVAHHQLYYSDIRQELDPRDKQIIHPFSFAIPFRTNFPYGQQSFVGSQEYNNILKETQTVISIMCENVVSASFKMLNQGSLTQHQVKDFASKNILSNIEGLVKTVFKQVKLMIREREVEQFVQKFTLQVDNYLLDVMKNLAAYYPQAPPAGNTAKMREVIINVNREGDQAHDLIFNRKINIDKYMKWKVSGSGQILNNYEDYTGFIMEVINAAISVTKQTISPSCETTVFEKFVEFSERLFCTSQHKYYKIVMNDVMSLTRTSNIKNQDDIIVPFFKKIFQGMDLGIDRSNFLTIINNFLTPLQQAKSHFVKHKKPLNTSDYFQLIKAQYDEQLQHIRKEHKYAISQKIPAYVRVFNHNQQKNQNFSVNDSAVLRIMTKWAQNLENIFKNPEQNIMQRQYQFKNTKNQLVTPNLGAKLKLYERLEVQYKTVKAQFQKLKLQNTQIQSYFLTQSSSFTQYSYLKRYTDVRFVASQINASLVQLMRQYLCILIHHLLKAGANINQQCINLVVFRVHDLLRSKYQCNEATFINILNTLYLLDKSKEMHNLFKLVRVKNKLDSKDNNILINYMFLGKVECELQLSIQDIKGKQKNYYNFNHFIYELTRGEFGAITECAIIVSQHDPIVNRCADKFYKPKLYQKFAAKQHIKSQESFRKIYQKNPNMFICKKCRGFTLNQNVDLFCNPQNICNKCISSNKYPQSIIKDEGIRKYICQKLDKGITKIKKYSDIKTLAYVLALSLEGKQKGSVKLYRSYYHLRQFKYFLIQINSSILSNFDSEKFEYEQFDYYDVEKCKANKELLYVIQQDQLQNICQLISIPKILLKKISALVKCFECFRVESILVKAIKSKDEVIDMSQDYVKLQSFNSILQLKRTSNSRVKMKYLKNRNFQLGNIKFINANNLNLQAIPDNITMLYHLESLNLQENKMEKLTLSDFHELANINASSNALTTCDISSNRHLSIVDLSSNKLTELDVSKNPQLMSLNLQINQLTEICLSKNLLLTILILHKNNIKKIDVTHNLVLTYLNLSNNLLTSIDLTKNPKLQDINLSFNLIDKIDLSANPGLINVNIFKNKLEAIDVSSCSKLVNLQLSLNNIKAINLAKNGQLAHLTLYKNQLKEIDLSKNLQLTNLNLYSNFLTDIDLTANTKLRTINLYNNRLQRVDLSKNRELINLDLSYNRLTTINLRVNVKLSTLDLRNNTITPIVDISQNKEIADLSLTFNKLSTVLVAYNRQMKADKVHLQNQSSNQCEIRISYAKEDEQACFQFKKDMSSLLHYKNYKIILVQS